MSQLKDIKTRIESVKKTRKITQAMKMVAAAKFKRATHQVHAAEQYQNELTHIIQNIGNRCNPSELPQLSESNSNKKEVFIIVTADRGLCGGFNSTVLKHSDNILKVKTDSDLCLLGGKGAQYYTKQEKNIVAQPTINWSDISKHHIYDIVMPFINQFKANELGKLTVIHMEFKASLSNTIIEKQLLPVPIEKNTQDIQSDFIYDSGQENTLDKIMIDFIYFSVYKALLESRAAEEGARMAAMDAATDNAGEMINSLSLIYNRTRQAQITKEITEIVAGAESLAH